MPHALTERQKEYLQFLQNYIRENEITPRLEEVASHFGVSLPTAHKTLDALERKGFLFTRRESASGYYVRLADRGGGIEKLIGVFVVGKIDEYGEIHDFPEDHGSLPVVLMGVDEYHVFALEAAEDIPQVNILAGDILLCDFDLKPQPGDIAIMPWGKHSGRWFLSHIISLTYDQDLESLEISNMYPIPENLLDWSRNQRLHWLPITFNESTEDYFMDETEKHRVPVKAIPPEFIMATVLRLTRNLVIWNNKQT